jgi:hypothetical protein
MPVHSHDRSRLIEHARWFLSTKDHDDEPQQYLLSTLPSMNTNCCGGDEKKNAAQSLDTTERMNVPTKVIVDSSAVDDQRITSMKQQHTTNFEQMNDKHDHLLGKKDVLKVLLEQLTRRALKGPMNSSNDDPPRLCTKKHVNQKEDERYSVNM